MKKLLFICTIFGITHATKAQSQIPNKAEDISPLLIGERIPNANLLDVEGHEIQLKDIIKVKPTVLVFYRGGWCPYCNTQLSSLAESENEIIELGYQIVAISPDHYENLKSTMEADKVTYNLYADPEAILIQDMGIGFKTPSMAKMYIANKTKMDATDILPVPTVMILNTFGDILFEYINPNYKVRLSSELLLASLKVLKAE
ncbi:antioxidant AhpC [Flavobacteriaceae bacterium LYZ1037]|nr:antioxidant AhpC [Flavobacteriaceae bacterium LYZ1037]